MTFDSIKYKNQFAKEHYSRQSVSVPIDEAEAINAHWKAKGYKGFSGYCLDLIHKDMKASGGIVVGDITQMGDNNSVNIGK